MRILHTSDCGSPDFMALYHQCDVVVTTGDLDLVEWKFIFRLHPSERKPAFGVYGNHDSGPYMQRYFITPLHRQYAEYGGFRWLGWDGCLRYKAHPFLFTEVEADSFATSFSTTDILLLHAPPQGMLDDPSDSVHAGSPAIRRYVLNRKPRYVFCGHVHLNATLNLGETEIYRTYGSRLIEI